jgi:transposase
MNRLHIRPPTPAERAELERWARSGKTAWYQRARTILLATDSGLSGTEVARVLGLHANTTLRWLHQFDQGGLTALAPKPRGGRARTFGNELAEGVISLLHEPPEAHGCQTSRWTLRDVATVLVQEGQAQEISIETVRRLLKQRRHSWQRAKEWLTSPDPQYAFKKSGGTGGWRG